SAGGDVCGGDHRVGARSRAMGRPAGSAGTVLARDECRRRRGSAQADAAFSAAAIPPGARAEVTVLHEDRLPLGPRAFPSRRAARRTAALYRAAGGGAARARSGGARARARGDGRGPGVATGQTLAEARAICPRLLTREAS